MNKIKLISGVILLFLVGVLCGILGTGIYFKQRMKPFGPGGPPMPVRIQILMDRFSDHLNLTDVQKDSIKRIVMESHEQVMTLGKQLFPEIEKINEDSVKLIKEQLDDNQSKKFEHLYRQMMDFYAKEAPPPGTPDAMRERYVSELKVQLNLTDTQEKQVRSVMKARDDQREKDRNQADVNEESYEKKLEAIFDEKQLEKYRELRSMDNFRKPPPPMPPPAPGSDSHPFVSQGGK